MAKEVPAPPPLTMTETAARLRVTVTQVRRLVDEGRLEPRTRPVGWSFDAAEVERALEARRARKRAELEVIS